MKYDAVFMMGIGGIGMSALARYFLNKNILVFGYDKTPSKITENLTLEGAKIVFNEDLDFIKGVITQNNTILYIKTPAIPQSHKYFQFLNDQGVNFKKRAEVLGEISKHTKCLSVAGTHGKTTISSMLACIMREHNEPMVAFLGGITKDFNSNFYIKDGEKQFMVVEADEYDRSFLQLESEYAVISNVDPDHLDIYGDEEGVIKGFNDFAEGVKKELIVHSNFSHLIERDHICYGSEGDYTYEINNGNVFFYHLDKRYALSLNVSGKHNIENALAAFSIAVEAGVDALVAIKGLEAFKGIGRRFDVQIDNEKIVYIDDYAHHPFEIGALIKSVRDLYPNKKIVGAFQPHLFSRTKDFVDGFRTELSQLDELVLLDIYPAREEPMEGIDSDWLNEGITSKVYRTDLDSFPEVFCGLSADVYLTLGAGDIGTKVEQVKNCLLGE